MEEFLKKLKEYNSLVTGSYFSCDIRADGFIALRYKYPMVAWRQIFSFDNVEDFLSTDCLSVINGAGFIQVKDK